MATIKENWTMPARVGKPCSNCGEVWQAFAWVDGLGRVNTIATCECNIMDVPWPLNELRGDFRPVLESVGFTWTENPNDPALNPMIDILSNPKGGN